jgi:hypothetical protein
LITKFFAELITILCLKLIITFTWIKNSIYKTRTTVFYSSLITTFLFWWNVRNWWIHWNVSKVSFYTLNEVSNNRLLCNSFGFLSITVCLTFVINTILNTWIPKAHHVFYDYSKLALLSLNYCCQSFYKYFECMFNKWQNQWVVWLWEVLTLTQYYWVWKQFLTSTLILYF